MSSRGIAVVVPVWSETQPDRSFAGLAPQLAAAFAEPVERIAVFNGAPPRPLEQDAPHLERWAVLSANVGVGRAWNVGTQLALADIVCFLNEDVRLEPRGLVPLIAALRLHPRLAVVGPSGSRWDLHAMTHLEFVAPGSPERPAECDVVSGFAFAIRRQALLDVGGFDVRFSPAGGEEVDVALSLRCAGWRAGVIACPGVSLQWGVSAASPSVRVEWIGGSERVVDISYRVERMLRWKWRDGVPARDATQAVPPPKGALDPVRARTRYAWRFLLSSSAWRALLERIRPRRGKGGSGVP